MSCGISVRFQTLSPCVRQVAHALLTRPPLSYLNASRRINQDNSVRLACVRHAASVRPEPGSNSLKSVYIRASLAHINLRALSAHYFALCAFGSLRSVSTFFSKNLLKKISGSFSRCLIFKVLTAPAFRERLIILLHHPSNVKLYF